MSRKLKAIRSVTSTTAHPQQKARERLKPCVLEELWSIWKNNPRVPSIESRRLWAASRNASPHLVNSWFLRRRAVAKKAGQPPLDGPYNLSLDQPVVPQRREPSAIPIRKREQVEAIPDLSSDDTLAYLPDDNNLDASSDTAFDEDVFTELKEMETTAYNQQLRSTDSQFQTKLSSADLNTTDDHPDEDIPSFRNPSLLICNQGMGNASDFMCILCSEVPDQDEDLLHFATTSHSTDDPGPSTLYARLDFSLDMLSELSAIPFLFCTPSAVPHDTFTNPRGVDDWSMVEDELGHLVNEGNLDFSFLGDPRLTSVELFDRA